MRTKAGLIIGALLIVLGTSVAFILNGNVARAGGPLCTWTGAGANALWSTDANWTCESGTVPTVGTSLIFPMTVAAIDSVANNDLLATNVYADMTFNGTGTRGTNWDDYDYHLTGNEIRLAGDITVNTIGSNQNSSGVYIQSAVTFTASAGITVTSGSEGGVYIAGDLTIGTNNLAVTTDSPNPPTATPMAGFESLYGSGAVTLTGNTNAANFTGTFSGTVTVTEGLAYICFGSATLVTVEDGASLSDQCGGTIATDLVFLGAPHASTGYNEADGAYKFRASLNLGDNPCGSNNECYFKNSTSGTLTLNGDITLGANIAIAPYEDVVINGPITGAYSISSVQNAGLLTISSSANGSNTPNSSFRTPVTTLTISDSNANSLFIGALYKVVVNGQRGDIEIQNGGILGGSGVVGNVFAVSGGVIAPGVSPEVLDTGNINMAGNSTLNIEIGGTALGSYDRLNVTGTVAVTSTDVLSVSHYLGFIPALNDQFVIINNDGVDAITGTFLGLAEGSTILLDEVTYTVSYVGGDGNDLVLTATTVPGPPDTAGVIAEKLSIILPAIAIVAAIGALVVRSRILRRNARR